MNDKYANTIDRPLFAPMDAFQHALVYQIPDEAFESLVRGLLAGKGVAPESNAVYLASLLKDCAALRRTNYARILVKHGADVEDAIARYKESRDSGAVEMLRQLQSEFLTNKK